MPSALVQKLSGVRDLKKILAIAASEVSEVFQAKTCQIILGHPLDPNVTMVGELGTENATDQLNQVILPIILSGQAFGQLSLLANQTLLPDELSEVRLWLAELAYVIQQAQLDDIIQRQTFANTFLTEISNVMSYSLGIADALFMVVNILGKVLHSSRCIFICTDDTQAGWKCYEFWQQDKVKSCREYYWPTTNSAIVAQTLLASAPLVVLEGQPNSYSTPAQEELRFLGVRSLLGIPLTSEANVYGCVIVQECEYRRAWTPGEIDLVQSVADKVASALLKLPAEKLTREPIMQLHQRIIPPVDKQPQSLEAIRNILKGVLGQQAIPAAQKTSVAGLPTPGQSKTASVTAEPSEQGQPGVAEVERPVKSLGSILGGIKTGALPSGLNDEPVSVVEPSNLVPTANSGLAQSPAVWGEPEAGEVENQPSWTRTDNQESNTAHSSWGDLDAIPTPSSGQAKVGLGAVLWNKHNTSSQSANSLFVGLHKDKNKVDHDSPEFIDGPPMDVDEAAIRAKFDKILSFRSPTSDYIFATPGLDLSMLGRIDGWVSLIEQKDKYRDGHTRQVAEYAIAIAHELKMSEHEVSTVRMAALVHDIGKLGTTQQILQKRDEDLNDEELLIVMKQPLDGAELLSSFPELEHLAPIVGALGEDYNGNGYPSGCKGEEIPLIARVVRVASTYHALISPKVYGEGRPSQIAAEIIARQAGAELDPRCAQAMLAIIAAHKVPPG